MSRLSNGQAVRWIVALQENLTEQRRKTRLSPDKRLQFLSEQYQQLFLLHRAIQGTVLFVGVPPIGESQSRSYHERSSSLSE